MSLPSTSVESGCTGLFDNQKQQRWYRSLTRNGLREISPGRRTDPGSCHVCGQDIPVSDGCYGPPSGKYLYDIRCHTSGLLTVEAMRRIARGEASTWKKTDSGCSMPCALSVDVPPRCLNQGPFEGGRTSGPETTSLAAHSACIDRVRVQKAIYDRARKDGEWLTSMESELVDMDASVKCGLCHRKGGSRPRRGLQLAPSDETVGAGADTLGIWVEGKCVLEEAERLSIFDRERQVTTHQPNFDLDLTHVFDAQCFADPSSSVSL